MFAFLHKWHKKIGIAVALFVVGLVLSGIAINHSHEFGLNDRFIKNDWLLDIYQIKPDKPALAFEQEGVWVSQLGERVYFNNEEIAWGIDQLFGVVWTDDTFVIAMSNRLAIMTMKGEVVENISGTEGVPAGMRAIGVSEKGEIIIKAAHGFYQVDLDELKWEEFDHLEASWSESSTIPANLEASLLEKYRGTGLTFERVLLDLHSGRILGQWGVYLVDLVAILFLLLALSGSWMWWKTR